MDNFCPTVVPPILRTCLQQPNHNRTLPAAPPFSRHYARSRSPRSSGLQFYRERAVVQLPCEAKRPSLLAQPSALTTQLRHFRGVFYPPIIPSRAERRSRWRLAETQGFSSSHPTRWALREALISSNWKRASVAFLIPPTSLVSISRRKPICRIPLKKGWLEVQGLEAGEAGEGGWTMYS